MAAKPIPDGYHSATPYLVLENAAKAIEFYKQAFGAVELFRMAAPGGKNRPAEIKIGDSPIMLADEFPEMGYAAPRLWRIARKHHALREDVDACFNQAVKAGAKAIRPVKDEFYGDRAGTIEDPFGHKWTIATHKEDVSPEEIEKRYAAVMAKEMLRRFHYESQEKATRMWFPGGLGCFRASFRLWEASGGSAGVSPALPCVRGPAVGA